MTTFASVFKTSSNLKVYRQGLPALKKEVDKIAEMAGYL